MLKRILHKSEGLHTWAFPTPDPKVKLIHFDVAGSAQASRDVMNDLDVSFTDVRLTHDEFLENKDVFF